MAKQTNIPSQIGWEGITDDDYVAEFGLDPNGDINKQMFEKVEQMNANSMIADGMDEGKARSKARSLKLKGMKAAKEFGNIDL